MLLICMLSRRFMLTFSNGFMHSVACRVLQSLADHCMWVTVVRNFTRLSQLITAIPQQPPESFGACSQTSTLLF